jgi:hypothetical protein
VAAVAAARRIMPPGMLAARPGLPAATLAMFGCAFAFFAVDGFVPLLLTAVYRRGVGAAGIVVTLAVLSWTLGAMAARGEAAAGLAGPLVADRTGTALGAGAGGVCIAEATRAGLGVGPGIGLGLAVAAVAACALLAAARRSGRERETKTGPGGRSGPVLRTVGKAGERIG